MKFIEKLEEKINLLLEKGWDAFIALLIKLIPAFIKNGYAKFVEWKAQKKEQVKNKLIQKKHDFIQGLLNFKQNALPGAKNAIGQLIQGFKDFFASQKDKGFVGYILAILKAPFVVIGNWLGDLSINQKLVLGGMTFVSVLSLISVMNNTKKIYSAYNASRAPASVEEVYSRPDYYKKQERELSLSTFRLPVYVKDVGALRALIIDFSVITSNRSTKKFLAKQEFQLRDHLINTVEPVIPSFPLEEEGREIIKEKLKLEFNNFLMDHEIAGEVLEVKIIYALAH